MLLRTMTNVVVVGCGVIGAAIAYELSQVPGLRITVLDRQQPAQAATRAALGLLMGAVSQKLKGHALQMRLASIQRYNEWIPALEAMVGRTILFNQQGILRLCMEGEDLEAWKVLADVRQTQGWRLELRDRADLSAHCPQLNLERVIAAVYSPQDRQVDPVALTLALVEAAQQNGVNVQFNTAVTGADASRITFEHDAIGQACQWIETTAGRFAVDWLIIAAGLGSTPLTAVLNRPVDIRPVLGQAVQVHLDHPLGDPQWQPVISGEDTHIVPLGGCDYWVGATVEFPDPASQSEPIPDPTALEIVMQRAIALCPALAKASITLQWSGLRPRPEGRPAPVIERLPGYGNVLLATGHYRNGILLAPATAEKIRAVITET